MNFPIFEALMMVCFGLSWPASICKSWRSRTNKGKSIFFLFIILFGYVCGLAHKLVWQKEVDRIVWIYVVNTAMVLADICLYFRNAAYDRRRSAATGTR